MMDLTENVTFTEIPEFTTEKAVVETEHPEAYLYQVAYDFFMYMDPVILIVGLVGNTLSFLVMQVGGICFFTELINTLICVMSSTLHELIVEAENTLSTLRLRKLYFKTRLALGTRP